MKEKKENTPTHVVNLRFYVVDSHRIDFTKAENWVKCSVLKFSPEFTRADNGGLT